MRNPPNDDDPPPEPPEGSPAAGSNNQPPDTIRDLALACARAVEQTIGVPLDGTQDTLPVLDHYVRDMLGGEGTRDEILSLVVPMCGAYFGEVVRRHLPDGRWYAPDDDYEDYRLEFERCFLYFNPIALALEVAMQEEGKGGHFELARDERQFIEDNLATIGRVRREDYYSFSVRFEVIEHVHEKLVARRQEKNEDKPIGPDEYEKAVSSARAGLS